MKLIKKNISLRDYSNYRIGGPAAYFLEVSSKEDIRDGIKEWNELSKKFPPEKKNMFILSGGSNVLIDDKGFDGLVILDNVKFIKRDEYLVETGSAVLVKEFLNFCIPNCLSGFEWAGGLPGTIGGAVRGNAGAFGGETKDSVLSVKSINLTTFEEIVRKKEECEFAYRTSIFKKEKNKEFILSVVFKLQQGVKEEIDKLINEKIDYRKLKHPVDFPSLGSTFKNIPVEDLTIEQREEFKDYIKDDPMPVLPVAKLLHVACLKGKRIGDAQVSEKHPNFIVNLGNASSKDVRELISFVKEDIKEKFNILLEEEIVYLPR